MKELTNERNMRPKLSFVVPVYNVEKYLRKCVESLIKQDYSNYEIILVDDGSTDGSGAICDTYVSDASCIKYDVCKQIRVIHQENGGLSAARNAGSAAAKGEYICFVDSDDYWEENVLGGLMAQIERDKLDVLRFKYQNVRIVNSEERIVNSGVEGVKYEVFRPYKRDARLGNDYSETVTDGVSFLNSRMNTQCYAVMFIVRRVLLIIDNQKNLKKNTENGNTGIEDRRLEIGDCLFTEGIYFEDTDWTPRMLCRAKRVASTDTIVYNYLVRQGSITNAVNRSKQKKVLDDKMRLISTLQQQAIDLYKSGRNNVWYQHMIADTIVGVIGMLSSSFYVEKDAYLKQLQYLNVIPIARKSIKARLINLSPSLAVELLHLKNGK